MDTAAAPRPQEEEDEEEEVEEWVEVPYQYQEEEVRQKDSFVEEIVEKKIPQVKAMYPYQGHGLDIAKGEVRTRFITDQKAIKPQIVGHSAAISQSLGHLQYCVNCLF